MPTPEQPRTVVGTKAAILASPAKRRARQQQRHRQQRRECRLSNQWATTPRPRVGPARNAVAVVRPRCNRPWLFTTGKPHGSCITQVLVVNNRPGQGCGARPHVDRDTHSLPWSTPSGRICAQCVASAPEAPAIVQVSEESMVGTALPSTNISSFGKKIW